MITAKQKRKKNTDIDKFRSTAAWQNKREEIKDRDNHLCQICIRKLYNTINQFTYDNVSVHHAIPIEQDYAKRLDNDNLITLCDYHHEMAESGEISVDLILNVIQTKQ